MSTSRPLPSKRIRQRQAFGSAALEILERRYRMRYWRLSNPGPGEPRGMFAPIPHARPVDGVMAAWLSEIVRF